jgi:hypothetical protein
MAMELIQNRFGICHFIVPPIPLEKQRDTKSVKTAGRTKRIRGATSRQKTAGGRFCCTR